MQLSQVPSKVPLPFAESGTKNIIPTASQIGITPGAASLTDGFPPLTFTPLSAGGVPPSGADFNGIFNLITAIQQWQSAGGNFPYDASFAASIGGYPKGAFLLKASGNGYWMCLSDNNSSNPDTGGAGWIAFDPSAVQSAQFITAPDTGTANAYAIALTPAPTALTPGMLVQINNIVASNTGASTLNVNGLGALPIQAAGGQVLQGGEFAAGFDAILMLNHAGSAWNLLDTTGGKTPVVAASQSNHAVNLGQIQSLLAGNKSLTNYGYVKRSDGLIEQWGITNDGVTPQTSVSGPITFNLPIPFPNGVLSANANDIGSGVHSISIFFANKSQLTVYGGYNSTFQVTNFNWRAIGW